MLGKHLSKETKLKISNSQKKRYKEHPEKFPKGAKHPFWKGGKTNHRGYIYISVINHPKLMRLKMTIGQKI